MLSRFLTFSSLYQKLSCTLVRHLLYSQALEARLCCGELRIRVKYNYSLLNQFKYPELPPGLPQRIVSLAPALRWHAALHTLSRLWLGQKLLLFCTLARTLFKFMHKFNVLFAQHECNTLQACSWAAGCGLQKISSLRVNDRRAFWKLRDCSKHTAWLQGWLR